MQVSEYENAPSWIICPHCEVDDEKMINDFRGPRKKLIWYEGEGDGDKLKNNVQGWKGGAPFQSRFPGKGTGGDFD
jgi:hypothetical protein